MAGTIPPNGEPHGRGRLAALRHRARIHLNHLHAGVYARSGGRLLGRMGGHDVLLLTTIGRHSGQPRRTPVQYERIGNETFIVAANGGAAEPPAWWHNTEATAEVMVQIGGKQCPALALTVDAQHRAELWHELCARNPRLEAMQHTAGREFPVVQLLSDPARDPPLRRHLQDARRKDAVSRRRRRRRSPR